MGRGLELIWLVKSFLLRFFLFAAFLASGADAAGPSWAVIRALVVDLEVGSLVTVLFISEDMGGVRLLGWWSGCVCVGLPSLMQFPCHVVHGAVGYGTCRPSLGLRVSAVVHVGSVGCEAGSLSVPMWFILAVY